MDLKVIFEDTFVEDLERIVRLIAIQNPAAAHKLGETIIRMAESLSFFPERFPKVRQRTGIRRFIVAKHFKPQHFEPQRTQRTQREQSVSESECVHLTDGNSILFKFTSLRSLRSLRFENLILQWTKGDFQWNFGIGQRSCFSHDPAVHQSAEGLKSVLLENICCVQGLEE
jgi:plasmid stabilization system protein ParE